MARPKRKPRTADRIVLAIRDRLVAVGQIEVVRAPGGRYRAIRMWGTTYGPGHDRPADSQVLRIHAGRGRPPAGTIGLIAAIAAATGYSARVVHRALSGAPRAGSRRAPNAACPLCGHGQESSGAMSPSIRAQANSQPSGLEAVGLSERPMPPRVVDPLLACRQALREALDAAVSMAAVTGATRRTAEALLEELGAP